MLVNAGISILPAPLSTTYPSQVQASATSIAARELGIDVASYQSADLTAHAKAGSQIAIVKVTVNQPLKLATINIHHGK